MSSDAHTIPEPPPRAHPGSMVVVGGGVIGLSIAWRCAQAGISTAVVDESGGRGSSWAAAGMLAPITEVHYGEEDLLRLTLESARRYPSFVSELEGAAGVSAGYRECGTLIVAPNQDDFEALSELFRFQRSLGLEVEQLGRKELRDLEPALAPGLRGGFRVAADHEIDNRALVDALRAACRRVRVRLIQDRVEEITTAAGVASGVRLARGDRIDCDVVVLAGGCWSGAVGGVPPEALPPVRPVKGQLVYLHERARDPLIGHNVRGADVYIVPRGDGRIVIGATVEEQGFDTTVTADAVYELLRDAFDLVPGLAELEVQELVAGLRPGSPDNAPILGPTALEGLVVATGHFRNGILLAPVTADAVAELVVTGLTPELIAPFSPQRFERAVAR